jgi:hypothetical protein
VNAQLEIEEMNISLDIVGAKGMEKACYLCGSKENLSSIGYNYICGSCAEKRRNRNRVGIIW